ncbi:MAG: heme-binding protein [Candidatus Korobacteraceae bacterium]
MTDILKLAASVMTCALILSVGLSAQLLEKKTLSLAAAKKMVDAAEVESAKNKWNMVIAILDDGGNLIELRRMDGTQLGSIEVAQAKARSALLFRRPTKAFADMVKGGNTGMMALPGALPVQGGLPIEADGKVIGSIGVSGATSEQDEQVALAAIAALTAK